MTDSNERAKLNGCGWLVIMIGLAFIAAILYVLFSFGSFLGGL